MKYLLTFAILTFKFLPFRMLCYLSSIHRNFITTGNWGEPERAPHWLKSVMVLYVACTDCENDKIRLTSHSSFVMVSYVTCTDCENDKIRLTSHSSFVMVSYVACTDCENDKIRFTSHSSLSWSRTSRVRTVRTIKYDGQAIQRFIRHVCRL